MQGFRNFTHLRSVLTRPDDYVMEHWLTARKLSNYIFQVDGEVQEFEIFFIFSGILAKDCTHFF